MRRWTDSTLKAKETGGSVKDTEGSVDRSVMEPSFLPLWIARCSERQERIEVNWSSVW